MTARILRLCASTGRERPVKLADTHARDVPIGFTVTQKIKWAP